MIKKLIIDKNVKDLVSLIWMSKDPFKLALEISNYPEFENLSYVDKSHIMKHINMVVTEDTLNRLNYDVCNNVQKSLNEIKSHINNRKA